MAGLTGTIESISTPSMARIQEQQQQAYAFLSVDSNNPTSSVTASIIQSSNNSQKGWNL